MRRSQYYIVMGEKLVCVVKSISNSKQENFWINMYATATSTITCYEDPSCQCILLTIPICFVCRINMMGCDKFVVLSIKINCNMVTSLCGGTLSVKPSGSAKNWSARQHKCKIHRVPHNNLYNTPM